MDREIWLESPIQIRKWLLGSVTCHFWRDVWYCGLRKAYRHATPNMQKCHLACSRLLHYQLEHFLICGNKKLERSLMRQQHVYNRSTVKQLQLKMYMKRRITLSKSGDMTNKRWLSKFPLAKHDSKDLLDGDMHDNTEQCTSRGATNKDEMDESTVLE